MHSQAMGKIDFAVVQAAGSSVRFDPPAKTARPISFHRVSFESHIPLYCTLTSIQPHPDSTLTPPQCKWCVFYHHFAFLCRPFMC
jgi:hypothetical protein